MFEAAFRIDETGRGRGAAPKLPAKEIDETPDPRLCDAVPAFKAKHVCQSRPRPRDCFMRIWA